MEPRSRLSKAERQERILDELSRVPSIRISDIAGELGVSGETLRRDLLEMGESGLISRTYGGAVARPFGSEPPWETRLGEFSEERRAITAAAAKLIGPGETLIIDSGSTSLHFARRLAAELRDLTVITNSFAVAAALAANATFAVLSAPGRYDLHEGNVTGPETVAYLEPFHVHWAVIGGSGLTPEGPNEAQSAGAAVKRTMLSRAQRNMLLLDHSKFDRLHLEIVCPLQAIDRLVTDCEPPDRLWAALEHAAVEVMVAGRP
jgi:DeoR/GlpR family transcriptional regulator of sugar metabolism